MGVVEVVEFLAHAEEGSGVADVFFADVLSFGFVVFVEEVFREPFPGLFLDLFVAFVVFVPFIGLFLFFLLSVKCIHVSATEYLVAR